MKNENAAGGAILTLAVSQKDAETISDWVAEHLEKTVVELKKPGGTGVLLEVYFDSTLEAEIAARALGGFPVRDHTIREYVAEEWTESWKKHFKPMDVGQRLRVCPPWLAGDGGQRAENRGRRTEKIEIVINPGLSFGTGNHFTTRFCLEQLDRLIPERGAKTMADIGTGSGILAIAAIKLGAESAVGADFDPLCVEQAIVNAEANGVAEQTEFFQHDITEGWSDEVYDIVCANIYASLLIDHAATLLRITGKYLLLTGIREVELDGVADTFVRLGGRELTRDCDGEWSGLVISVS
ncbi:MAG TPA: 50S ribosomal protein L11 methyltransferase [Tichowtungia sp.]|nr:50S ribosomal protein L11 methyltransferase [Tichowtungia sp.]